MKGRDLIQSLAYRTLVGEVRILRAQSIVLIDSIFANRPVDQISFRLASTGALKEYAETLHQREKLLRQLSQDIRFKPSPKDSSTQTLGQLDSNISLVRQVVAELSHRNTKSNP